mgnify:CR=1 FL=1
MCLVLFVSETLVRTHGNILLFFGCCWAFISVIGWACHWSASLHLLILLRHPLAKRSSHWARNTIINHTFAMCLGTWPKLILITAVCPILAQNGVLQILIIGDWTHEVIILGDQALICSISWLRLQLRLRYTLIILRFHVLRNDLIFWHVLFLGHLLTSVKSILVRSWT